MVRGGAEGRSLWVMLMDGAEGEPRVKLGGMAEGWN